MKQYRSLNEFLCTAGCTRLTAVHFTFLLLTVILGKHFIHMLLHTSMFSMKRNTTAVDWVTACWSNLKLCLTSFDWFGFRCKTSQKPYLFKDSLLNSSPLCSASSITSKGTICHIICTHCTHLQARNTDNNAKSVTTQMMFVYGW